MKQIRPITEKQTQSGTSSPHALYILSMKLNLVDPITKLEFQPFIYLGVHGATGLAAGFAAASPDLPEDGIVRAIINCHQPKGPLLSAHGLSGSWPLCGPFDLVNVPEKEIGEFAPVLSAVCRKHGVRLKLDGDDDVLPETVCEPLLAIPLRIETEFCLEEAEIECSYQRPPDIIRRLASSAFRYWPGKGFVERLCPPLEWETYCENNPLRFMHENRREEFLEDLETVSRSFVVCRT
jgi:hypothetical protein